MFLNKIQKQNRFSIIFNYTKWYLCIMRNQNNMTRVIKNMKKIQEVRGGNN